MARETTKALKRRLAEDKKSGYPFWGNIFVGDGLDVGSGDDPLLYPRCKTFDIKDGDANNLSAYFEPSSFDYIHASQLFEHLYNPDDALSDWWGLLKSNGWLIITVPDWELYEGKIWPSRYNGDHKSTWSLTIKESPAPMHVFIPELKPIFSNLYTFLVTKLIDTNYDYNVGTTRDQTQSGAEAFIELVLRKR